MTLRETRENHARDSRVRMLTRLCANQTLSKQKRLLTLIKCAVRLIGSCISRQFRDTHGKSREWKSPRRQSTEQSRQMENRSRLHEPGDERAIIASYLLFTSSLVSILYSALERSSLLTSISIMRHLRPRVSKYVYRRNSYSCSFPVNVQVTRDVLETAIFNSRYY